VSRVNLTATALRPVPEDLIGYILKEVREPGQRISATPEVAERCLPNNHASRLEGADYPDYRPLQPGDRGRAEICVIALKIFVSAVRETEMIADPKRKPQRDDGDSDKRRRQEEALDEALKNTFPASDPVSVEQPTTSGRAWRS
jgi:hypothetical protein